LNEDASTAAEPQDGIINMHRFGWCSQPEIKRFLFPENLNKRLTIAHKQLCELMGDIEVLKVISGPAGPSAGTTSWSAARFGSRFHATTAYKP
jgi:hypothetical protein